MRLLRTSPAEPILFGPSLEERPEILRLPAAPDPRTPRLAQLPDGGRSRARERLVVEALRLLVVPVAGAVAAIVMACGEPVTTGGAGAPAPNEAAIGSPFEESFDGWDRQRWSSGVHELGRGRVDSLNVGIREGVLEIVTPAGTREGGEILSRAEYHHGAYMAALRCGTPRGTVCAFFLYEADKRGRNDEIDIEVLAGTRELWLTTWARGRQTNHIRVDLGFDPADGVHSYGIEYRPRAVSFRVDGVFVRRFTSALPTRPMHVMANAWWPIWRDPGGEGGTLSIDSIRAAP